MTEQEKNPKQQTYCLQADHSETRTSEEQKGAPSAWLFLIYFGIINAKMPATVKGFLAKRERWEILRRIIFYNFVRRLKVL